MSIALTRNDSETITTVSKEIMKDNLRRTAFYITNTGAVACTICKGTAAAVLNTGIVLQANSTFYESDSEGFNCWKGTIQAISSGVGTTLAVSETIEV